MSASTQPTPFFDLSKYTIVQIYISYYWQFISLVFQKIYIKAIVKFVKIISQM
ncbi:MAG: hypothetical protein F6K40_34140 [Okeania sp. SIO3I5]|uniref:hypothetical protein n=1 Tax=Okeania sp. SIO3I5 TaxID=2607805 RepID=UPI0013BC3597|nr:hypothetical protein [Okeania sp. SIO3I5]NEQ40984.1 hypothetical protein [Okeania sp. SIO3I5]NEQ40985.1 hypothetical protein [Okeania sp. SIO3I5]